MSQAGGASNAGARSRYKSPDLRDGNCFHFSRPCHVISSGIGAVSRLPCNHLTMQAVPATLEATRGIG